MSDYVAARRCSQYIYDGKDLNRCEHEAITLRDIEIPSLKSNYSFHTSNNVRVNLSIGVGVINKVEMYQCAEHAEVHDAHQREMNK